MKNIQRQLQSLVTIIRQLQTEVESLKRSGRRELWVCLDADSGKYMCPEPALLSSDLASARLEMHRNNAQRYPNTSVIMQFPDDGDGEHSNAASIGADMKRMDMPLTNRETEILRYVAEGNSNKQIAYILIISEQTVKTHISAILRKLNANDRAHAVSLAMRDGWLSAAKRHGDMIAVS